MSFADFNDFKKLFPTLNQSVNETFKEFKGQLEVDRNGFLLPSVSAFEQSLGFLSPRDKITFSLLKSGGAALDFYGVDSAAFLEKVGKYAIDTKEPLNFQLTITKLNVDGVVSVYNLEALLVYFEHLTLEGLIYDFHQQMKTLHYLTCEVGKIDAPVTTPTIAFTNQLFTRLPSTFDRQPIIDKARNNAYFNLLSKYDLVPQDFFIEKAGNARLVLLLNKLSEIYASLFLFDTATINGNKIEYKLNGYKTISGAADFKKFHPDARQQYFQIFQWVYGAGNFTDKIGLARNIVSLNLTVTNNARLIGNPLESIKSAYKVYEKQNIKQYIEIRNKISDQLLGFHDRANKILETFASGFQKSALALISFYISAIILKTLNKDKLVDVFTWDASLLSTGFIACAWLYLRTCQWEMKAQTTRFKTHYGDLKKRYTDLLTTDDIQTILNSDEDFKNDLEFIRAKGRIYTRLWIGIMVILLVMTWSLYLKYH